SFGYFRAANLPDATADLFARNGTVDFDGGQWVGRESVRRLLHGRFRQEGLAGTTGPQPGVLNETYVLQPVIDIAADARSASARFRGIEYLGQKGIDQHYGAMLYEALFTIEDGHWVFRSLV